MLYSKFLFRVLTVLFLFSKVGFSYSHKDFEKYKAKYPNQKGVILNHNQKVNISVDKKTGELEIFEMDYEELLYLTESAKFFTNKSIYTSDFFEDIIYIKVTVYDQSGKKWSLSQNDFKLVDSPPSSWVFHDDNKEMVFNLKKLGKGFRTEIEYQKKVKRPEFFDVFHFTSNFLTEKATLEIAYPETVDLTFYKQNLEKFSVVTEKENKKKMNKITWTIDQVSAYKEEEGSVNAKNYVPHLLAQINGYQHKNNYVNLIGSPKELHNFFQKLLLIRENQSGNEDLSGLYEIVDNITKGMDNETEKMDTIFRWVQDNIKYIALEDGINGYVPRACSQVVFNRYGDCKDMGNLLVEMLNYADVPGAHVAWVGTRDIPYLMSEIPTPLACNHVICVVDNPKGGYYYLDATQAHGGYTIPPSSIQEKELLVHNKLDDYVLYKVPAVEASQTYVKSKIVYYLDENDSIRGTGNDIYSGYERNDLTYYFSNLEPDGQEEYVRTLVLGNLNRYTLQEYRIVNLEDRKKDLEIMYDFSATDLFIKDNENLILNPTLFKPRITKYNKIDHSFPRFKDHHRTVNYEYEFKIPEGYFISKVPENVVFNHEFFEFSGIFKLEKGTFSVNMTYTYRLLEISSELYPEWNTFSNRINQATIQNIILQKRPENP